MLLLTTACSDARTGTATLPAAPAANVSVPTAQPPTPVAERTPRRQPPPATTPPVTLPSAKPTVPAPPVTPHPTPDSILLPTHGESAMPRMGTLGHLEGDAASGCVWLREAGGRRTALLWPAGGYRARFGPLRVYDASGREVWRAGQVREAVGTTTSVHVDRLPRACRTGDRVKWLLAVPTE